MHKIIPYYKLTLSSHVLLRECVVCVCGEGVGRDLAVLTCEIMYMFEEL